MGGIEGEPQNGGGNSRRILSHQASRAQYFSSIFKHPHHPARRLPVGRLSSWGMWGVPAALIEYSIIAFYTYFIGYLQSACIEPGIHEYSGKEVICWRVYSKHYIQYMPILKRRRFTYGLW